MTAGAYTPEELETLFEDAFFMRNHVQLCALFDDGGLMAASGAVQVSRGAEAIGQAVAELWDQQPRYVPARRRVLQARDTALVVSDAGLHVARRGADRYWRVAICLLDTHRPAIQEDS
jgi:hypothetical protein